MNKQQKNVISLAINVSVICFSIIAASTATFAWFSEFRINRAENMVIKVAGPEKNVNWDVLKYDDDQKAGIAYHDEKEFFLPSFDRYISEKNIYSNCILKALVNPPSGFDETQQLYVDITCTGNLFNGSEINDVTSNICQFKTTVYSYIDYDNVTHIMNTSIDGTNADTQYRTATDFFAATDSGSLGFVTVNNDTAKKENDKVITLIPRFECDGNEVKQFLVYIECTYKKELVDYYLSQIGGESSGETIDLTGDITNIKFRFGEKYTGSYTRVTAGNQLTKGDRYMIMYDSYNAAFDGSGDSVQYYTQDKNYIEVERNGNRIKNNETVNNADWTYTNNNNLQSHSGYNVGRQSGATGIAASTSTNYANTLTYNGAENMTSVSNSHYLKYDNSTGETRFNYFSSSNAASPIQIYKYGDEEADNVTFTNILLSGTYRTQFNIGDVFEHTGMTVTAYYSDGSHKEVTASCAWTGYNMNAICQQEITVSYTEDGVTRNASYYIDVLSEPTVYVDPTTLIGLVNGMGTIRATSVSFEGPVTYTWSNNDNTVARLSAETGDTIVVTYIAAGFSTITCHAEDEFGNVNEEEISVRVTGAQASSDAYVKVTSLSDITTGDYLIVNEGISGALDGTLDGNVDAPQNYLTVSINRNLVSSTTQTNAIAFHYDATQHTLANKKGLYLGNNTKTNKIKLDKTKYQIYFGWDTDHATVRCQNGRDNMYLRFNSAIAQQRFRFYDDINYSEPVQLYKLTEGAGIRDLVRIEISGYKTEFKTRDRFEYKGVVYAIFSDGTQENVTADAVFAGYNMERSGTQQVTVAYTFDGITKTAVYNITLTDPDLVRIELSTVEAQTEYYVGDPFNRNGLKVTAKYSNGSSKVLEAGYTFSGITDFSATQGLKRIKVNYNEGAIHTEAEYEVRVFAAENGWRKVSNSDDLEDGDHIMILSKQKAVAMSSIQNANVRDEVAITKATGYINTMGNAVSPLTIHDDNAGSWTLYDPLNNGYLTATSSVNNSLETPSATVDWNSHWAISIKGNGDALIQAKGENTNNVIRYNEHDHFFSCYQEGQQKEVLIYKYYGTYAAPIINVQSISLSSTMLVLNVGDTRVLEVIFTPYTATDKGYDMISGNGGVISCNASTGLITAMGAGESVIYVTSHDGAKTAQCHVTVNPSSNAPKTQTTGIYSDYLLDSPSFILKGGIKA